MTVELRAVIHCNWPGCERVFHHCNEVVCFDTRRAAESAGWTMLTAIDGFHEMDTPDFCPIHPQHDGAYLGQTWRLRCLNCDWIDEDPVEPDMDASFARWIAHLPRFIGEMEARAAKWEQHAEATP